MDRRDRKDPRQSSLPRSLIPHLYSAPQQPRDSSTRTTLTRTYTTGTEESQSQSLYDDQPESPPFALSPLAPMVSPAHDYEHHQLHVEVRAPETFDRGNPAVRRSLEATGTPPVVSERFGSLLRPGRLVRPPNFTSSAGFAIPPLQLPATWREGEAGPSSLLRSSQGELGQGIRGPARGPGESSRGRTYLNEDYISSMPQSEEYQVGSILPTHSTASGSHASRSHQGLPPPPFILPEFDDPTASQVLRQGYHTYPGHGRARELDVPSPASVAMGVRNTENIMLPISDKRGYGKHGIEFEEDAGTSEGSQKNRKRRTESVDTDDASTRARNPRKTAVACNFCRGRKLRCNGAKPACNNCTSRKFECEYVPVQRRRGPGKAPKGSRSKKGSAATRVSDPSVPGLKSFDPTAALSADYDFEALAPELRPYTSVMSLEQFSYDPPEPSNAPSTARRQRGRRTPRSRESSSEEYMSADEEKSPDYPEMGGQ